MTDHRRQTIAALQGNPADLPLLIANKVLCNPPSDIALRIVARSLGIIGPDYDTSCDAGKPQRRDGMAELARLGQEMDKQDGR